MNAHPIAGAVVVRVRGPVSFDQQAMLERSRTAPERRFYGTVDEAVAALSALAPR